MTDLISSTDALAWRQSIAWSQGPTKLIRREEFTALGDGGPLDVRGDGYEAALLVNGNIEVFQWGDCEGSVGQNLVRALSCNGAVRLFRESVEAPISTGVTLASHFSGALKLLAAGNYALVLEEVAADSYVVDLVAEPKNGLEITGFYPGFGAMIATQPLKELSPIRVDHLVEQIQKGAKPTIITLCAEKAWGEFIVDGHHKIAAYRRANVPAVRLNIIRRSSERLAISDILNYVPDTEGLKDNLRKNRAA